MRNSRLFAALAAGISSYGLLLACGGPPKLPPGPPPEYEEPQVAASAPTLAASGAAGAGTAASPEGLFTGPAATGAGAKAKPPTPDEIALIAKRAGESQPKLVACYDEELRAKRKTEGKMMLRFVVQSDGTVKEAGPEGETAMGPELVACIVSAIKAVKFDPRTTGDATVMLPLTFTHAAPKDDAGAPADASADAAKGKKKK
jgi:hypothetical protein